MDEVQTDDPFADTGEIVDGIFEFEAAGYENGEYYVKFVGYEEFRRCSFCSMYTERIGKERMTYLRQIDEICMANTGWLVILDY